MSIKDIQKQKAINAITKACDAIRDPREELTAEQSSSLESMQTQLLTALKHINNNNRDFSLHSYSFMGRQITDSWPIDSELGEKILEAKRMIMKWYKVASESARN